MNDLTQRISRGFDVAIFAPAGDETDIVMRIEFGEALHREIAAQKKRNLRKPLKPGRADEREYDLTRDEQDHIALIAACTVSWSNIAIEDEPFPCSLANAVTLYTRFPWVRRQVDEVGA
jgi:hypothetical protein